LATPPLSPVLCLTAAALFALGLLSGLVSYLHRSPVAKQAMPGTAAWGPHIALAVLGVLALGWAWSRQHRRPASERHRWWLLAPLGTRAARRAARTARAALESPAEPGRALLALLPAALISYCAWRAGDQVIGGLDPNFTVDAWGGPSYLGAMACHYLDCWWLTAVGAWLADRILCQPAGTRALCQPAGTSQRQTGGTPQARD